jgi:hypothetical protein
VVLAVRNRSALPTSWLEEMVAFADPGLTRDWRIEFLPAELPHGLADPHRRLALVYVAGDPPHWCVYLQRKAIKLRSGAEACVFVTGHELRHLWQHEQGMRLRVEPLERDADAFAAWRLRAYRRTGRTIARAAYIHEANAL